MIFEQTIDIPRVSDNSLFEDVRSYLNSQGILAGKEAEVPYGVYDTLDWQNLPGLSEDDIISWGTKTLPGAGAFYFANHESGNPSLGHLHAAPPEPGE